MESTSPPARAIRSKLKTESDVLVYSTPPLAEDTEVTGPVTLDLYAKTSAADTDFTAKLVDVGPDGKAHQPHRRHPAGEVSRVHQGRTQTHHSRPGYEYKIDVWSTSNVFLKGHKIRLEVSSSNFPRFDRNLNTGNDASSSTEIVKATNTILHDAQHPSALILPVVARRSLFQGGDLEAKFPGRVPHPSAVLSRMGGKPKTTPPADSPTR